MYLPDLSYVGWLKTYSKKYKVSVHAWVLKTNHVHLLYTPSSASGISQMMQSLGRMYVAYFNRRYKRTGTLWEGRFTSCLLQEETYLMQVYVGWLKRILKNIKSVFMRGC